MLILLYFYISKTFNAGLILVTEYFMLWFYCFYSSKRSEYFFHHCFSVLTSTRLVWCLVSCLQMLQFTIVVNSHICWTVNCFIFDDKVADTDTCTEGSNQKWKKHWIVWLKWKLQSPRSPERSDFFLCCAHTIRIDTDLHKIHILCHQDNNVCAQEEKKSFYTPCVMSLKQQNKLISPQNPMIRHYEDFHVVSYNGSVHKRMWYADEIFLFVSHPQSSVPSLLNTTDSSKLPGYTFNWTKLEAFPQTWFCPTTLFWAGSFRWPEQDL